MIFALVFYAGLIIVSALGVLWGIGALLEGMDHYRVSAAVRTTPVAQLDSVAVGPTAVSGRVEPVSSPFSPLHVTEQCVAFDLSVEDISSGTSNTHVDRRELAPFDIVSEAGSIRVRDEEIDLLVSDSRRWEHERDSHERASEPLESFERAWEIPDIRSGDTRQYEATYLEPGDSVYAYGTADVADGLEEDDEKPLVLTDRGDVFFISDRDLDELLRERRFALAREALMGVTVSTVSLAAFLWLTGIAQVFLGV
ncbi:E3 Ubiquitin ligase family protein [Halorhabdus sp. SVX81]|uniref:hypothetical protein n=1 Tax=Halorhabdus sp. SVX81 TaxID=2978283 RepID=UPI0023DB976B|nr:hypothetical protein [Halorhabdus sp. SVX81]WEL16457.1 E3 Ubiquitin ligase family protein [Halorhabdus sp. SVX81]